MSFGLYIHMPFCRRRCPYCDFYKKVPRAGEIDNFPSLVERELEAHAASEIFSNLKVTSIYFGGGTPSLHSPKQIQNILETLHSFWSVEANAEITLEANPGTASLSELHEIGINRLSLGIQSFSQHKLNLLFRDHDTHEARQSFQQARAAGFTNISFDLIFGLPDENLSEWLNDINTAVALEPDHISLYNLEYHSGTPFHRWKESSKLVPLSDEAELEMYLTAHEKLTDAGFVHYEISNLARPGFRSHHNTLYWTGKPYLGVGPSAHSYDGERLRFENPRDLTSWQTALESLPESATCENLTDSQLHLEWLSTRLRLAEGVNRREAIEKLGERATQILWQATSGIPSDLIETTHEKITLAPRGWFCQNDIIIKLFKNLDN